MSSHRLKWDQSAWKRRPVTFHQTNLASIVTLFPNRQQMKNVVILQRRLLSDQEVVDEAPKNWLGKADAQETEPRAGSGEESPAPQESNICDKLI